MKYWHLVAIGVVVGAASLAATLLLWENDPSRGVFILGEKRIKIAQNKDGSVEWDGRLMTCDEITIVLHEAEKNCGRMPVPFDKIHFGPFNCLSTPTPEELKALEEGRRVANPNCPEPTGSEFFTGNSDALMKIKDFASQRGLVLEIVTAPNGDQQIPITSSLRSNPAFNGVFKEALNGKLGIGLGTTSAVPARAQ